MAIVVTDLKASALASGGSLTITNNSGDLLLAIMSQDSQSTFTTPFSGSALFGGPQSQAAPDGNSSEVFYNASGPGSASYAFTFAAGSGAVTMLAVSGHNTSSPINAQSASPTIYTTADASPVTITVPGITTTVDGCLLVMLAAPDVSNDLAASWTKPTGWTSMVGTTTVQWPQCGIAYTTQATAGATGSVSCTFTQVGSSAGYIAYLLAIAPSTAGAVTQSATLASGAWGDTVDGKVLIGGVWVPIVEVKVLANGVWNPLVP